jgi:hypothetical protein
MSNRTGESIAIAEVKAMIDELLQQHARQTIHPALAVGEAEAARITGYSVRTLFSYRESGELPFIRATEGGKISYLVEDLKAFLKSHRHVGNQAAAVD